MAHTELAAKPVMATRWKLEAFREPGEAAVTVVAVPHCWRKMKGVPPLFELEPDSSVGDTALGRAEDGSTDGGGNVARRGGDSQNVGSTVVDGTDSVR